MQKDNQTEGGKVASDTRFRAYILSEGNEEKNAILTHRGANQTEGRKVASDT